ncbi:MAG: sensor histidine kinase [Burkholderiales bacterium]|jgi:signal transduction histidine kinase
MTKLPWLQRLHVRLALAVGVALVGAAAALLAWQEHTAQQRQDAYLQWQSLNLAQYIADRRGAPWVDAEGRVTGNGLADTAMYIGMIQPALEVYLLDARGQLQSHALPAGAEPARTAVDLAPLRSAINAKVRDLPIYGDDPRDLNRRDLISVAPLLRPGAAPGSEPVAYFYVVLRGAQARNPGLVAPWQAQRGTWWVVTVGVLALAGLAIVWAQQVVTRRLRGLASRLSSFRAEPADTLPAREIEPEGDEIDQLERSARALQQRVRQQIHQLEDADRLRRELVSNLSHDLHTPLANVRGYLDTLLLGNEQLDPASRREHIQTAVRHCLSLQKRVAALFELSRLEARSDLANPEPYCLAELLQDVVQDQQLAARQRGVTLRLAEHSDRQARVLADIALMERVLQNLIDNALRACKPGGCVELSVHTEPHDPQRVHLRVQDDGAGIAASDLPRIFERYWTTRVPSADGSAPQGGLGLSIVRRIVDLHGGSIAVHSQPQKGAAFVISLPAVPA